MKRDYGREPACKPVFVAEAVYDQLLTWSLGPQERITLSGLACD